MAREGRSHVRKRKKGCLVGCLTNLMLLLGVIALVFVGAHVLGFVESDPQTGAPTLKLDHLPEIRLGDFDLSQIQPPDFSGMTEKLPKWAYGVNANGLTVKTLRAGDGEAVFVCADGYTMLLGAGSGTGASLCGQLLLCGVPNSGGDAFIDQYQPGGFVLFAKDFENRTADQIRSTLQGYQDKSRIPMVFSVDEEGGEIVRVRLGAYDGERVRAALV